MMNTPDEQAPRTLPAARLRAAISAFVAVAAPDSGDGAVDRAVRLTSAATPQAALDGARAVAAELAPRPAMQSKGPLRRASKLPVCVQVPQVIAARDAGRLSQLDVSRLAGHLERCAHCTATAHRFAVATDAFWNSLGDDVERPVPPAAPPAPPVAAAAAGPVASDWVVGGQQHASEPVAEPEPEPEPVAEVEPEPVAQVEPEPVAQVEPEPAFVERVAEAEPEPEPVPFLRALPTPPPPVEHDEFAWVPATLAPVGPAGDASGSVNAWAATTPDLFAVAPNPAPLAVPASWETSQHIPVEHDLFDEVDFDLEDEETDDWLPDDAEPADEFTQGAAEFVPSEPSRGRRRGVIAAPGVLLVCAAIVAALASGGLNKKEQDDSVAASAPPPSVVAAQDKARADARAAAAATAAKLRKAADHKRAVAARRAADKKRKRAAAAPASQKVVARTPVQAPASSTPAATNSTPAKSNTQPQQTADSTPPPTQVDQPAAGGPSGSQPSSEPGRLTTTP